MKEKTHIRKSILAAALLVLSVTAHFLPFERAALAPDDYASLVRSQDRAVSLLSYAERPLNYLFLNVQSLIVGDNAAYGFILLLASSFVLLISVFLLLNEILRDEISAFFAAMIFCLLPNTLEIYHTAIFANMNFAFSVYIFCLLSYLKYLDSGKVPYLAASIFLYATGIFWYEVGFFTPLIMLIAALLKRRERVLSWLLFLPLSAVYTAYRVSGVFGLAPRPGESHAVSLAAVPFNILELLHHYVGRYLARSVLYGLYRFPSIEIPWLIFICVMSIAFLLFAVNLIRKYQAPKIPSGTVLLACSIFIFWLAPILLNERGGIAGRHLVLPSVGIAVVGLWLFNSISRGRGIVAGILILFFLAVSQGNAWSQVVACRINAAVYNYLKENIHALRKVPYVIIDAKSFADNIPFTFVDRDFNVLNTYYGAQAFEEWGLKSMVRHAAREDEKAAYVAKTRPRLYAGKAEFGVPKYAGYRSEKTESVSLDAVRCLIVDYDSVYPKGFRNGLRIR